MLKRAPLLLLLSVTLALGQVGNQPRTKTSALTDAIKLVSPSVVQITYELDQFPEETLHGLGTGHLIGAAGTGFVVNEQGYIITALHVLRSLDDVRAGYRVGGRVYPPGRNRLLIGFPWPNTDTKSLQIRGSFSLMPFVILDTDAAHDLALLKLEQQIFAPGGENVVATFSVTRPEDGTRVAVSGYPLGEEVLVTTSGAIASSWGFQTHREALPNRPGITLPKTEDVFLVDMHVNHGNSGGPVYSVDTGTVIGVADAYALEDNVMLAPLPGGKPENAIDKESGRALETNAGLGVVVPARYVVELLKKNNVKWKELSTTSASR